MGKAVHLFFVAMITILEVCTANLDYMVTVEQPVTLVTHNLATRQNGTCCSPVNANDCTVCPDDPSVEFTLFVCFRRGFVRGFITDTSHCPLGGVSFTPNRAPGPQSALTPRPEAASLPREYPGSVQLLVRIMANMNGEETILDDVLVVGRDLPADNIFRRISFLSMKQIAIVSVNARVQCTNGATTADCSVPTTSTSPTSSESGSETEAVTTESTTTEGSPLRDQTARALLYLVNNIHINF